MKTTLNKIRKFSPCGIKPPGGELFGMIKLMRTLGKTQTDDEPITIIQIIESNGIQDAIWCLRAVGGFDKEIRLFKVWCAGEVQHLMKNQKSIDTPNVSERYANRLATREELSAAYAADAYAYAAASDYAAYAFAAVADAADAIAVAAAASVSAAAYAAAYAAAAVAAYADADADAVAAASVSAAAYAAAAVAAYAAADVAAVAYAAAVADAVAAAYVAAADVMRAKQEKELRRICQEILEIESHETI